MAQTNFAKLTTEQKTVWSRDLWKIARNNAFLSRFLGTGQNSMVQRITDLTESEKGARAVLTLLTDLTGDGISGDNQMEGREEEIKAYDRVVVIDQLRNANRTTGKMADQRSIVNFREQSRDQLAYWLADRMDQLAFQTLAGIGYGFNLKGAARASGTFSNLDFAGSVSAPSAARRFNWEGAVGAEAFGTYDITEATLRPPSWKLIVQIKAEAKDKYIRGIRGKGGEEVYHVFLSPKAMAMLKLDSDYLAAARSALPRSKQGNELWTGTDGLVIDGTMIHEYRHIPQFTATVQFAAVGIPAVDGCQMLICGAQALAFADIGNPDWIEKYFDYDNQRGIRVAKMMGFYKPLWISPAAGADEDFGVMVVNVKDSA